MVNITMHTEIRIEKLINKNFFVFFIIIIPLLCSKIFPFLFVRDFLYLGLYTKDGDCEVIYGKEVEYESEEVFHNVLQDSSLRVFSGLSVEGERVMCLLIIKFFLHLFCNSRHIDHTNLIDCSITLTRYIHRRNGKHYNAYRNQNRKTY